MLMAFKVGLGSYVYGGVPLPVLRHLQDCWDITLPDLAEKGLKATALPVFALVTLMRVSEWPRTGRLCGVLNWCSSLVGQKSGRSKRGASQDKGMVPLANSQRVQARALSKL